MKITLFAISAILLSAVCAQAQMPETWRTMGYSNGRYWATMNEDKKLAFVVGYVEAVKFTTAITMDDNVKIERQFEILTGPENLTYAEIIKAIDQFYESPLNGPISIGGAFMVMSMQARGKDQVEIQKFISESRRGSTATPEPPAAKAKQ
jgi:hypothetical protein